MPRSWKTQSGFTLVELLIAVVILAVGLLGLAELQVTAIKANSQSAATTDIAAVAQRAIEEFTAMAPDDARLDASGTGTLPSVTVEGGGTYTINWTVVTPYDSVSNLCQISIVVASTSSIMSVLGNKTRTLTVRTLKRAI